MLVPFAKPHFTGHRFRLMTRLTSLCRCRMQLWLSGKMPYRNFISFGSEHICKAAGSELNLNMGNRHGYLTLIYAELTTVIVQGSNIELRRVNVALQMANKEKLLLRVARASSVFCHRSPDHCSITQAFRGGLLQKPAHVYKLFSHQTHFALAVRIQPAHGHWHLLAACDWHLCGLWMLTSRILSAPHLSFPKRATFHYVSPSTRGCSHTCFARFCGSPRCLRAAGCGSHTRAAIKMLCFIMQTDLWLSNCPSGTTGLAELKRRLPIGDTFCSGLTPWHGGARQVA